MNKSFLKFILAKSLTFNIQRQIIEVKSVESKILGINKNTSFLLPPKVNTSQRASLVGVESGAIIYNTSLNKLQVYVGSGAYNVANWQNLH